MIGAFPYGIRAASYPLFICVSVVFLPAAPVLSLCLRLGRSKEYNGDEMRKDKRESRIYKKGEARTTVVVFSFPEKQSYGISPR